MVKALCLGPLIITRWKRCGVVMFTRFSGDLSYTSFLMWGYIPSDFRDIIRSSFIGFIDLL